MRAKKVEYIYGNAEVVYDLPEKISSDRNATELHLMTQLEPHFEDIKNELIIFSPYFVPGKEGVEFFKSLTEKGVRVKILTNSLASMLVSSMPVTRNTGRHCCVPGSSFMKWTKS